MRKAAVVLNWIMIALFGIVSLILGVRYSAAVDGSNVLLLLPYSAALLAFKSRPNRLLIGGTIFLNALMIALAIAYAGVGISVGEAKGLLVGFALLPSPLLNCVVLKWAWNRTRAATA